MRHSSAPFLPIVPSAVLRRHRVLEARDTRFRACARLLQALWRQEQSLPIGTFRARAGKKRRIGSLLAQTVAEQGRNFLTPAVASWTKAQIAYQQPGAFIEQSRLARNMLSSQPAACNLLGPLGLDRDLAVRVLRRLLPSHDIRRVLRVLLEHSPGRRATDLTGDRSAFDVAIEYERSDSRRGFIGFEIKYSETMGEAAPLADPTRLDDLASASGLFKEPRHVALRLNPLQQLFREHLLAAAAVRRGDYAEATFILIAPHHNHLVQRGAALYAAHLAADTPVPFINIELEEVINAFYHAGENDYAAALHDRYCAFEKVHALVARSVQPDEKEWPSVRAGYSPRLLLAQGA
jgi:hypothetical protein